MMSIERGRWAREASHTQQGPEERWGMGRRGSEEGSQHRENAKPEDTQLRR